MKFDPKSFIKALDVNELVVIDLLIKYYIVDTNIEYIHELVKNNLEVDYDSSDS